MTAPVLAIDIGGTKILAALVSGAEVIDAVRFETPRDASPDAWLDKIAAAATPWRGRFDRAGAAVTGWIRDGRWSALNPATLPVPADYPLTGRLSERLDVPVAAANDAQAAAWGEYRFGAGQGHDIVFLTVSTGIGGGIVSGGRLVTGRGGVAGHVGQIPVETPEGERKLEDIASGAALARLAAAQGGRWDVPGLVDAANAGDATAERLLGAMIAPLARALRQLQFLIDPDVFVIGGGLGLAEGVIRRIRAALAAAPDGLRPDIRAAALGAHAGLIGIADLVANGRTSAPEVNP